MNIRTAPVGARFVDCDGDTWTRTRTGARVEFTGRSSDPSAGPVDIPEHEVVIHAATYGPLVPVPDVAREGGR